jgi:hypothetical protein
MTPAKKWIEEFGLFSLHSDMTERVIRAIQHDAMVHAASHILPDGNPSLAMDRIKADCAALADKSPQ